MKAAKRLLIALCVWPLAKLQDALAELRRIVRDVDEGGDRG